jgi:NAD(P)-dependent dehydrogenase (short-subunit alcohol dehydrogenase family)
VSLRLADKVACITGAASGIGRATALRFAAEGATVVATDIDIEAGAALSGEIAASGGTARFLPHDVGAEDGWISVIARIAHDFGRLDVLVNNAGIGRTGPVTDMELADWQRLFAINVEGTFLGCKHALPLMRGSGGGGSIINVSSIAGIRPSANSSAYGASKGAVRAFTKAVALECAGLKDGIRINSVHPGVVETAIWDGMIGTSADGSNGRARGPTLEALTGALIPLGRTGTADEIADAILWLASDESRYVTGAELVIDGGRTIA